MSKQISIRFNDELHEWLVQEVAKIRPGTTINQYINHLVEKERNSKSTDGGRFVYYTGENE